MTKRAELFLIPGMLGFLLGCASAAGPPELRGQTACTAYDVFQVGTGKAVIFPAGTGIVDGYRPGAISEFWTPAREDIHRAEAGIAACLQSDAPSLVSKFSAYMRQYTGFYLDGRKLIFVQFFCAQPTVLDWRCEPVVVDDGGDCYFRLEYDMNTGACRNLWVNGSA